MQMGGYSRIELRDKCKASPQGTPVPQKEFASRADKKSSRRSPTWILAWISVPDFGVQTAAQNGHAIPEARNQLRIYWSQSMRRDKR